MSNEVNLSTFPSSYQEALALLYVQNQDLSEATPENLSEMYWEAYYRIRKVGKTNRDVASAKWYK